MLGPESGRRCVDQHEIVQGTWIVAIDAERQLGKSVGLTQRKLISTIAAPIDFLEP
jgi:hypothetical protein